MNELEQALRQLTTAINCLQDVEGLFWSADRYEKNKVFTASAERYYESALQNLHLMASQMDFEIRDRYSHGRPDVVGRPIRVDGPSSQ